jgi:hypothetical protein
MRRLWGVWIGVVLAEALLRLALFVPQVRGPLTEGTGEAGAELRWLYAWYAQREAPQFEADPALGWRLARRDLGSVDAPMSVDEDGARRPSPPRSPTPGALRVTAYGDSFAFAWDVVDEASWHAQLMARTRDSERPIEVVNLGVPGYDLGQVVLRRGAESDGWAPEVEVLLLHELLGQRTVLPFEHFRRPLLRAELGEREPLGVPIPSVGEEAWARVLTPHLCNLARVAALRARGGPTSRFASEAAPRAQALLDRFVEDVRADGRTPVILWLDLPHTVEAGVTSPGWMPRCSSPALQARCADAGGRLRALARSGVELKAGTHFSAAANSVIAEEVFEALRGL